MQELITEVNFEFWAEKINNEYRKTVDSTFQIGRDLIEAKKKLEHGEWGKLTGETEGFNTALPFGYRQSTKYMAIAGGRLSNRKCTSDLPLGTDTLYEITMLKKEEFDEFESLGLLKSESTLKDIKAFKNGLSYSEITKKIQDLEIKTKSEINQELKEKHDVNYGDVFTINGKHKLIIGDAKNITEIKAITGEINCILTDPPYGINYKAPSGNGLSIRGNYDVIESDNIQFEPAFLFNYSENIITWGGNHYANKLNNSAGWIIWDKRDGEQINNNSDCEMAWTNMLNSARLFHHKWNGMIKDSEREHQRIHPTQKPIKLFAYCLDICRAGKNIFDPFAGSGTTLIACELTNRKANLVEIDPTYGAAMIDRFINDFGYEVVKS